MAKTRINCPQCRQPIMADVNSLFDVGQDPRAKQMILSGAFNLARCPNCGYQGNLATPLVYHDPEKELLLTYFPPELGLPVNEQERIIGPLITQATNNLPQEKRKAYLLRPQTMFTMQTMIERILAADGITKEMLDDQQKRLTLLQRLMEASEAALPEIVKQEDALMDEEFFTMLARLMQAAIQARDENAARRLNDLQHKLVELSSFGRAAQAQSQEVEAAVNELRAAGNGLTREKLLQILIDAPNETRLGVLVSLARQGLDYEFFQLFSARIDAAQGEERQRLLELRQHVLELTQRIDQEMQARVQEASQIVNQLLQTSDVAGATRQVLPAINDFFIQALNQQMEEARRSGDLERINKLNQIVGVLQESSQPPAEFEWIEELLDSGDEAEMLHKLGEKRAEVTPELVEMIGNIAAQMEEGGEPEMAERVNLLHRLALRVSMQNQMAA